MSYKPCQQKLISEHSKNANIVMSYCMVIVVSFVATFKINIWMFTVKFRDRENFYWRNISTGIYCSNLLLYCYSIGL